MHLTLLIAGLLLLFVSGELLVRGAVHLAQHLGVSPLLIGLTVVGFGSSAPELLVCIQAALTNQADMAVGSVVGSNIANIMLILGVASVIRPLRTEPKVVYRDGLMMLIATVALVIAGIDHHISSLQGMIMLAALIAYLIYSYMTERHYNAPSAQLHMEQAETRAAANTKLLPNLLLTLGGLVGIIFGAELLVNNASILARSWGISEAVIGLSLVAIGTSLPELATVSIAAYKNHPDVAVGNVLGSNIFNILGMLGITAILTPLSINSQLAHVDSWIMLAVTIVILWFLITGWRLSRSEGVILLLGYIAYIYLLYGT